MVIGQYGLENPSVHTVDKFDPSDVHVVCFADESDNVIVGTYKTVQATDTEAVMHRTQDQTVTLRDKQERVEEPCGFNSINIKGKGSTALNSKPVGITPLGYLNIFEDESLVIFTGSDYESNLNYAEVHSREKVVRCYSECDVSIYADTDNGMLGFSVAFEKESISILSIDQRQVTHLKVEENNWLGLARSVENLGATIISLEDELEDLTVQSMF